MTIEEMEEKQEEYFQKIIRLRSPFKEKTKNTKIQIAQCMEKYLELENEIQKKSS